jgi:O-antigen/teichoic acid export membrane protein
VQSASIPAMSTDLAERPEDPLDPPQRRPLTVDVLLTFGNKVGVLVLNVAGTIVIARTLGPVGRGAIAVAFSITLLLVQFGSLGFQSANPYFAIREARLLPRVISNSVWASVVIGLVLIVIGIGVKALFPAALRGLDWLEVLIVLVGVPAALANTLLQSVLLAEGRMVAYNGVEITAAVITFLGLVIGLAVVGLGVVFGISLMVGMNLAAAFAYFILLRHHGPPLRAPDRSLATRMLRYGMRIYITTLLAYAVGRVNLIFVNSYLGASAAGQYSIGVSIADGMHLLPSVVALNLFPRIARGDPHERSAAVFRSLALLFALLCLITVPLAAPGIPAVFGSAFTPAVAIYYWLLPGIFAYGMLNVLSYHFAGRGFPLEAVLIWIPGLLLNLAIVVAFVPSGGTHVAALAATVSYALILFMHMRLFAKESGSYRSLVPRARETLALSLEAWRSLRVRAG